MDSKNNISYNKKLENEIRDLIYSELKTIKECNEWAKNSLKISHVDYKKFNLNIANRINRQLQILLHLYPEIETIEWVSDVRNSAREYFKNSTQIKTYPGYSNMTCNDFVRECFSEGPIAITIDEDCKYKGMWFSNDVINDPAKLNDLYKMGLKTGFAPIGTNGIEATVTHEFAHHMEDYLVSKKMFGYVFKIWRQNHVKTKSKNGRSFYSCKTIKRNLSLYAATDVSEFFAEAMAEYIHNPKPRPIAQCVGEKTDEVFRKLREQN